MGMSLGMKMLTLGALRSGGAGAAEPPEFVSESSTRQPSTASLAIDAPDGIEEGDVLVAFVATRTGFPFSPDGWMILNEGQPAQGYCARTFVKITTSSEPESYTFTMSAAGHMAGIIAVYRGSDSSYPVNASELSASTNSSSSETTAPSIITTVTNCVISLFWSVRSDITGWSVPEGVDARSTSILLRPACAAGDFEHSSGATGEQTATISGTAQNEQIGASIALAPTGEGVAPDLSTTSHRIDDDLGSYDAIYLHDMDGDGHVDVVVAANSRVSWFRRGYYPAGEWTEYAVATGVVNGDFEGAGVVELGGVPYIVAADSGNDSITLFYPAGDDPLALSWSAINLATSKTSAQDIRIWDIDGDGDDEIVYTWSGGTGGVHWLDFDGADPTDPDDWTDYTMISRANAWGLAPERVDLSGDGQATDIIFSCRSGSGTQGVFWLEPPETVTNTWTLHTIENRSADWARVDTGDFSGNGHGKDVIACDFGGAHGPVWYDYSDNWSATTITPPSENDQYNVRTLPASCGDRDCFVLVIENDDIYVASYSSGWSFAASGYTTQGHPSDEIIWWHDVNGDGVQEAFIADSSDTDPKLIWFKFTP